MYPGGVIGVGIRVAIVARRAVVGELPLLRIGGFALGWLGTGSLGDGRKLSLGGGLEGVAVECGDVGHALLRAGVSDVGASYALRFAYLLGADRAHEFCALHTARGDLLQVTRLESATAFGLWPCRLVAGVSRVRGVGHIGSVTIPAVASLNATRPRVIDRLLRHSDGGSQKLGPRDQG